MVFLVLELMTQRYAFIYIYLFLVLAVMTQRYAFIYIYIWGYWSELRTTKYYYILRRIAIARLQNSYTLHTITQTHACKHRYACKQTQDFLTCESLEQETIGAKKLISLCSVPSYSISHDTLKRSSVRHESQAIISNKMLALIININFCVSLLWKVVETYWNEKLYHRPGRRNARRRRSFWPSYQHQPSSTTPNNWGTLPLLSLFQMSHAHTHTRHIHASMFTEKR
jgi:hypothetical protein